MYIHGNLGNLGNGLDEYETSVDEGHISRLLTQNVIDYFNDPENFPVSALVEEDGTYGRSNEEGSGWVTFPHSSAPTGDGPKSVYGDITGMYDGYYRVPGTGNIRQWVDYASFERLSQLAIDEKIRDLIKIEVPAYLKGKTLSEVAGDLTTAINAVVDNVKAAINKSGSWFHGWGLSV
tara:strand:+ start:59 stop:592 length:534 start_codon:yes stop_codon:yes gene_type:complete